MRETESKFLEYPGNSELFKKQEEATSAITSEEPTEIADKTIEKAASKKRKQSVADEWKRKREVNRNRYVQLRCEFEEIYFKDLSRFP